MTDCCHIEINHQTAHLHHGFAPFGIYLALSGNNSVMCLVANRDCQRSRS